MNEKKNFRNNIAQVFKKNYVNPDILKAFGAGYLVFQYIQFRLILLLKFR